MGIEDTKKLKLVLSPSEIITELGFDLSNLAEEFKPNHYAVLPIPNIVDVFVSTNNWACACALCLLLINIYVYNYFFILVKYT